MSQCHNCGTLDYISSLQLIAFMSAVGFLEISGWTLWMSCLESHSVWACRALTIPKGGVEWLPERIIFGMSLSTVSSVSFSVNMNGFLAVFRRRFENLYQQAFLILSSSSLIPIWFHSYSPNKQFIDVQKTTWIWNISQVEFHMDFSSSLRKSHLNVWKNQSQPIQLDNWGSALRWWTTSGHLKVTLIYLPLHSSVYKWLAHHSPPPSAPFLSKSKVQKDEFISLLCSPHHVKFHRQVCSFWLQHLCYAIL